MSNREYDYEVSSKLINTMDVIETLVEADADDKTIGRCYRWLRKFLEFKTVKTFQYGRDDKIIEFQYPEEKIKGKVIFLSIDDLEKIKEAFAETRIINGKNNIDKNQIKIEEKEIDENFIVDLFRLFKKYNVNEEQMKEFINVAKKVKQITFE